MSNGMVDRISVTRRQVLGWGAIVAGGLLVRHASGEGNDLPPQLQYRFVNNTGGKWKDEECFWSLNNGRQWHSFDKDSTVPCPRSAGRLYLCVGSPPKDFDDRNAYWDFIEFACHSGTWYGNTTQVDGFCIPLTVSLGEKVIGITKSRGAMFETFPADCPKEFRDCVKGDFWIIAPIKAGFDKDGPHKDYFDAYVDEVWAMYETEKLTPGGKYTGKVEEGSLIFTAVGGGKTYKCSKKPSTQDILLGSGVLGPNPQFCAAFNRHVAADPGDWNNPKKFYQAEPCNWYSKFFHDYSINGKAYGFCYDDVADQAAFFGAKGNEVVVTLNWSKEAKK